MDLSALQSDATWSFTIHRRHRHDAKELVVYEHEAIKQEKSAMVSLRVT